MPEQPPDAHIERELALAAAPLVTALGEADFYARLAGFLRHRVANDSLVELAYHYHYAPQVLFDDLDPRDGAALYGRYFKGAYLLSPFYLRWRAAPQESALHRLKEIAPEGFFDSIYYTDYYGRSGLVDEMGFVVPTSSESAVLVSLGRTSQLEAYSRQERQRLHAVEPIVSSIVRRHWALIAAPPKARLKKRLADALALFGSTLLTEREQSVVQLMLRGHSSKSCARELGISPTTERVHRRHIYAKLGISSQAELFSLFFDALAVDDLVPGTDPLAQFAKTRNLGG
ncbi:MAG: helix-turn-helix transcriptional regulator [Gammaproteobacteria bacterium]|nr:helix-turn-helix transcriptional regulator [Gammaproteobacteria bacterium]